MKREEAKKWLNKLYARADITDEYGDMEDMQPYEEAVNLAIKTLEQQTEWIPIKLVPLSDEEMKFCETEVGDGELIGFKFDCLLPEDGQEVLVSTNYGTVTVDTFCKDYDGCHFELYSAESVIAWMPLPKPYETESEGKE